MNLAALKRRVERRLDVIWGTAKLNPSRPLDPGSTLGDTLLVIALPNRPDPSYALSVIWRGRRVFYFKRHVGWQYVTDSRRIG